MKIPVNFDPRPYQEEAMRALENGVKLAIFCWARRAGKDFTCFGYAVKKMVEKPMNVVLVFPTKQQGFEAFWTNVENDGMLTLDHIPKSLVASQTNSPSNMKVTLKNGSTFTLLGASEPDALRGANAKLYIFSEFVDINGAALDVIRPIVAVNGGQIIIQSTPKIDGISGGTFKILYDRAAKHPNQYASTVRANVYLDDETLEDLRQEAIEKNGNDFFWRQEFMCDWGQASSSSYYGAALQLAKDRRKIGYFPADQGVPVYTAWDLGTADSTAIDFFQYKDKKLTFVDYYETHDIGYGPIAAFLTSKPYNYGWHFIPFDGATREASDAVRRIDKLQQLGLTNSSLLVREVKEDGIRRMVDMIPNARFNEETTKELRRKLMLYKRQFNPLTGDYMGPEHKTESHAADATRYVGAAIDQGFDKQTGELLYSPAGQSTYEMDAYQSAGLYRPAGV